MSMNREPRRGRGEGRGGQGRGGTRGGARGEARGGARGGARGWQNQRGNGGRLPEGNEREDQQIRNFRNNDGRGDRRRQRDYNGQQHGQNVERIIHPIGYKRLEELTTLEPHETLHRLAAYKMGLEALLKESEIRFDLMIQLTTALANACSCKTAQTTLQDIVLTLQCENFLTTHLTKYIREMHHSNAMKEIIPNLLSIVLCILSSMLSTMPSLFNDVGVIILCLEQAIDRCKEINVFFPDEMSIKLDRLKEYQSAVENEEYKRDNERGRNLIENASPEDDFHDLPIFPLAEELKEGHSPFLRRNIVNKGYDDVNHYLDIQFRLLKEDFVAPLRNGISEYRWHLQQKNDQKHIRLQNAYVYHKVQVLEGKSFDEGIAYLARFSTEHLLRVNWERARRLLFGSLVCLSSDNFETVHFATVANRKTEDLQRGLIFLKFHGAIETPQTLFAKPFTMVESSAYFEAYRHVLKRIQEIREDSFPLEKYIVRVDPHLELPSYLRRNPSAIYDLKPVAQKGVVRIGGRSSSEKIKALNLKELRRTRSQQKQRAKHQYLQVKNIRGEMVRLAKEMLVAQKSVRTASSMILKENTLRDVIPHEQYRSLLTGFFADEAPNLKTGEFIAYWLGAIVGEHDTENALVKMKMKSI
ncbi:putative NFX1-type zinc finger-containing protein 1-like [Apostichopus japonicus]|uniref:Putative NFX1-type zinc finger-containing protein 1-like n=1 Tax=Stichopus japonicus TaxID=307972 RepID=A0A2G8LS31_STIJA|nr:putative NFX1-type zinc finger-containing protein 1-like [Apostichopus japonicus]